MGQLGVHVHTIPSSGVSELTERCAPPPRSPPGVIFLTNDSVVGALTMPRYFVTKLDVAIERMVAIELSDVYREPDASESDTHGWRPKEGAC